MDVIRFQVDLLALGVDCDRDFSPGGALLGSAAEPSFHVNAFYPLHPGFRYDASLLQRLRDHHARLGREGYLVRYDPVVAPDHDCAAILVPADACNGTTGRDEHRFACVRTDDAGQWCRTYVAGSPWTALARLEQTTTRLRQAYEVRLYLFTVDGVAVGAGSLVAMGGNAYMANGYSVIPKHRGDILGRARLVRMSTSHDVVALTSRRFARVLARAMPSVSMLGRLGYYRLATATADADAGLDSPAPAPAG